MCKRIFALLLCVAFLLLGLYGCANESKLRKVVLNEVTRSVFYAPLYVAVSLGYFEEEGMDINIVTGGGKMCIRDSLYTAGPFRIWFLAPTTRTRYSCCHK